MGDQYVQLSNGDGFKIFTDSDGSMYDIDKKGTKKKLRRGQYIKPGSPDVTQGASGGHKFETDAKLFRANLPPTQQIWEANKKIDKYTGFSQSETEEITFDSLSKVVKGYENFNKERAIKVERDHTVEVQMISHAWNRVNIGNSKVPNTRATLKCIRDNINHLDNLNCTPGAVNMKKKDAVKAFLRDYESENWNSGLRQNLLDYGVRRKTTRRICTTFEEAAHQIAEKVQTDGGRDVFDHFADEISSMIGYMKLD